MPSWCGAGAGRWSAKGVGDICKFVNNKKISTNITQNTHTFDYIFLFDGLLDVSSNVQLASLIYHVLNQT